MVRTCVLSRTGGEASHVLTVSLTYVRTSTYVPFHPRTYARPLFHLRTHIASIVVVLATAASAVRAVDLAGRREDSNRLVTYPISEITPSLVVTYVSTFNQTHTSANAK